MRKSRGGAWTDFGKNERFNPTRRHVQGGFSGDVGRTELLPQYTDAPAVSFPSRRGIRSGRTLREPVRHIG